MWRMQNNANNKIAISVWPTNIDCPLKHQAKHSSHRSQATTRYKATPGFVKPTKNF